MSLKRLLTGIIGFPIVLTILIFANKYAIDIGMSIVAMIAIYEYSNCAKKKDIKIISWLGYFSCLLIAIVHIFNQNFILKTIVIGYPLLIFILFLHTIFTDMKINFKDISFSLFGYLYIVGFNLFFVLIYGSETFSWNLTGKTAIWYLLFASWGSDTVAYFIGKNFGKHKFSKVSPNKTIEGCISGILGSLIGGLIFTFCINKNLGTTVPYYFATIFLITLSVIGQLGDFSASVVKRYFDVKDYSNLFPGHGGMLDRIDSVIFIAPFAYLILYLSNFVV
ncbi:MAG: phosphatidate cytidylyltransferase [Clostridia bacterium]|nr:phosphatidate cytidylyltransferase [Clostridia bacterium]